MTHEPRGDQALVSSATVDARTVGLGLVALVTALVAASVIGQIALRLVPDLSMEPVARRFNLDSESSVPAYVSAILLLAASALLALTARVTGDGWRSAWGGLSAVFVLLSMDEAMILHESLVEPLRTALNTGGVLYFAWVIPGALFVAVVGALCIPFLLARPLWLRWLLIASGAIYVGGALGMELVGGALTSAGLNDSWAYLASATVEETAEMAGVSLFIYALLRHLEWRETQLTVAFRSNRSAARFRPTGGRPVAR